MANDPASRSVWENRVLRSGALAGALAAIVGFGGSLAGLFGGGDAPPEQPAIEPGAVIKDVQVGSLTGINTAFRRTSTARTCKRLPAGALRVSRPAPADPATTFAVADTVLAQTEDEGTAEPDDPATTEEPPPPEDPDAQAEPDPPADEGDADATPEEDDSGEPTREDDSRRTGDDDGETGATTPSDPGGSTEIGPPGIPRRTTLPDGSVVVGGVSPSPGAPVGANALAVAPTAFSSEEEQTALAEVALTRVGPDGTAEALGRLIDLTVRLTALEGECIQLAWSLYDARSENVVPERWLQFRTGLRFVAGDGDVSASEQFWVPMPRRGGRFYVRIGLFKEDGTRLTLGRSQSFDQPKGDESGHVPSGDGRA